MTVFIKSFEGLRSSISCRKDGSIAIMTRRDLIISLPAIRFPSSWFVVSGVWKKFPVWDFPVPRLRIGLVEISGVEHFQIRYMASVARDFYRDLFAPGPP